MMYKIQHKTVPFQATKEIYDKFKLNYQAKRSRLTHFYAIMSSYLGYHDLSRYLLLTSSNYSGISQILFEQLYEAIYIDEKIYGSE